jgi:hypothetical protein
VNGWPTGAKKPTTGIRIGPILHTYRFEGDAILPWKERNGGRLYVPTAVFSLDLESDAFAVISTREVRLRGREARRREIKETTANREEYSHRICHVVSLSLVPKHAVA